MKYIWKFILGISFSALSISGCNFLNVDVIGKNTIDSYFADITSLKPAINGVYNQYYSFYDRYFCLYSESASDELVFSNTSSPFFIYHNFFSTSSDETSATGMIWKYGYSVINNANQIIEHIPSLLEKFPNHSAEIKDYLAQAYFMRALTHFQLCLTYGQNYTYTPDSRHLGVALRLRIPSLTETIARSSVAECYASVIQDLQTSIAHFSSDLGSSRFFASKTSARALLARVYLYMGDWNNAAIYASQVIGQPELSLTPRSDYVKMYCSSGEMGKEAIFRLGGYKQGTTLSSFYSPVNPSSRPALKLKALFENPEDIRGDFSCTLKNTSEGKVSEVTYTNVVYKYTCTDDVGADTEKKYCNPMILRLSEMYLTRAEAYNHLGRRPDAIEDLKQIMARAVGKSPSEITIDASDEASLDELIAVERMKELSFEGHRFFDLTRRHKSIERDEETTSTVKTLAYPDYRMILAIPHVEIDANRAMWQNPGYTDEYEETNTIED